MRAVICFLLVLFTTSNVHAKGISFVTGGIGKADFQMFTDMKKNHNVNVKAELQSGEYIVGVQVVIADNNGDILIDSTTHGPFFLIRFSPGDYTILATYGDQEDMRSVTIEENASMREVVFVFEGEAQSLREQMEIVHGVDLIDELDFDHFESMNSEQW